MMHLEYTLLQLNKYNISFQQINENQLLIAIAAFAGTFLLVLITWEITNPHKVEIFFPKEMVCIFFNIWILFHYIFLKFQGIRNISFKEATNNTWFKWHTCHCFKKVRKVFSVLPKLFVRFLQCSGTPNTFSSHVLYTVWAIVLISCRAWVRPSVNYCFSKISLTTWPDFWQKCILKRIQFWRT